MATAADFQQPQDRINLGGHCGANGHTGRGFPHKGIVFSRKEERNPGSGLDVERRTPSVLSATEVKPGKARSERLSDATGPALRGCSQSHVRLSGGPRTGQQLGLGPLHGSALQREPLMFTSYACCAAALLTSEPLSWRSSCPCSRVAACK